MAVSLPPLNGGAGHAPEEKRGTDIHKHNRRRGPLLPWLQPIPQMGPRDQGFTGKHTILPKAECPHCQLIENRRTPDAQIRILEFMYLSKYHPSHHLHSLCWVCPRILLKTSFRGPGPLPPARSAMALPWWWLWCKLPSFQMCAAYLVHPWPKSCKEPGGCFTLYLISSAGVKQTYLIFPCVCTFSSVFGANLLSLLYFMFHFTSHQFALPYYVYKISPNVYSKK